MAITAYPLAWPHDWKRVGGYRKSASFNRQERKYASDGARAGIAYHNLSVSDATIRVLSELRKLGCERRDDIVISTNVRLRLDGLPRSNEAEPQDPGAAVYWTDPMSDQPRCMAIDLYDRVADNLAAIAKTLDALRAIERHGGAAILDRAFRGFTALPAPGETSRDWRMILELNGGATLDKARESYRRLASMRHPDKGGSDDAMAELNGAWRDAQQALS